MANTKMLRKDAVTEKSDASSSHEEEAAAPHSVDLLSLTSISEALGDDKSPQEVLQLILKAAFSTTRATSASLMLLEPGTKSLRVVAAEGFADRKIFKTLLKLGQGVTGWVAETGVPLRIGNVTKDARYVRVQKGLRSELAVPLKIRGRVIGVISVDSTVLNHFTSEDEALLLSLAAQSARVIQTTRLFEETRRQAEELKLLLESSRTLSGTLDLNQVLQKLVKMAAKFWRSSIAAVYLTDEDGQTLTLSASHGCTETFKEQAKAPVKGSLLGRALLEKHEHIHAVLKDQPVGDGWQPPANAVEMLAVSLATKEKPLGVLALFSSKKRPFQPGDPRLLAGLARTAALAIESAQAHRHILGTEEMLRQAEKSALLCEMATALAHEIRNPLTSIKLLFDGLLTQRKIAEEGGNDATMIVKQIERLEQIVSSYLDVARTHAAVRQAKVVDLNAVVDESLLLLATSAHEGTRLAVELHEQDLPVNGDPVQLSQAIYNLVLNAIQAVSGNGNGRGRIQVKSGCVADDRKVWFEVADDGPGLPQEVQEHLFQPFFTTKKQGVGLGLSIVKRIVEAHGGRLDLESPRKDIGRGARFRIVLPEGQRN